MDRRLVLVKTPKGNLEVVGRTRLLPRDLCDLLLLIDGRSTLDDIIERLDASRRDHAARGFERLHRDAFFTYRELGVVVPTVSAAPSSSDASLDFTPSMAGADEGAVALAPPPMEVVADHPVRRPDARSTTGLNQLVTPDPSATPMLTDVVSIAADVADVVRSIAADAAWPAGTAPAAAPVSQPGQGAHGGAPGIIELTDALVLKRTMQGHAEIVQSGGRITPEAWAVLNRIDGKTSLALLRRQGREGEGVLLASLVDLIDGGYVEQRSLGGDESSLPPMPDPETIRMLAQKQRDQDEADEVQRVIRERVARDQALDRARQEADGDAVATGAKPSLAARTDARGTPAVPRPAPTAPSKAARAAPAAVRPAIATVPGPASRPASSVQRAAAVAPLHSQAPSLSPVSSDFRAANTVPASRAPAAPRTPPTAPASGRDEPPRARAPVSKGRRSAPPASRTAPPPGDAARARAGRRAWRWLGVAAVVAIVAVVVVQGASRWLDVARYELLAQEAFGLPVSIGSVRPVLIPRPALVFGDVIIGNVDDFQARSVRAVFRAGGTRLARLDVESVRTSSTFWWDLAARTEGGALGVDRVQFGDMSIRDPRWSFERLEANAQFADGRLRSVQLTNASQSLVATVRPAGGRAMDIEFSAPDFRPFDASFTLTDFNARGRMTPSQLALQAFDGRLGGAVIRGSGRLGIEREWVLDGEAELRTFELGVLAPALFVEARGSGRASFTLSGPSLEKMFSAPIVSGTVTLERGGIAGTDLARALQDPTGAAGVTRFQRGEAAFRFAGDRLSVSAMQFTGPNVSVSGSATLDAKQALGGRVVTTLRMPGRDLTGAFAINGTMTRPTYRRGG